MYENSETWKEYFRMENSPYMPRESESIYYQWTFIIKSNINSKTFRTYMISWLRSARKSLWKGRNKLISYSYLQVHVFSNIHKLMRLRNAWWTWTWEETTKILQRKQCQSMSHTWRHEENIILLLLRHTWPCMVIKNINLPMESNTI